MRQKLSAYYAVYFAFISFASGILLALLTPEQWWNGAYTPWYATWYILPSSALSVGFCLVCGIDFVSDLSNPSLFPTLQIISTGVIFGGCALAAYFFVALARGPSPPASNGSHE